MIVVFGAGGFIGTYLTDQLANDGGEVTHPVDKRVMAPKFLGGAEPDCKNRDRRAVMAKWLASPENPFFARNLVNIVWAYFMGKGIVEGTRERTRP